MEFHISALGTGQKWELYTEPPISFKDLVEGKRYTYRDSKYELKDKLLWHADSRWWSCLSVSEIYEAEFVEVVD